MAINRALKGQDKTYIINKLIKNEKTGLPKVVNIFFTKHTGECNRSYEDVKAEILSAARFDNGVQDIFEKAVRADKCPVWTELFEHEKAKPYMARLQQLITAERNKTTVYPARKDVFTAFRLTHFNEVRVVIIGQDPYHNGAAHGLAFSALGTAIPKSLQNIFKEIKACYPDAVNTSPNLTPWAEQGILLLNTSLTVNKGAANSHKEFGWRNYIQAVMMKLVQRTEPIIFVLWGSHAQEFSPLISAPHHVLKAAHPSPFSADSGFFGCRHFEKINQILTNPINWNTHV